jgi:hypothetical protein
VSRQKGGARPADRRSAPTGRSSSTHAPRGRPPVLAVGPATALKLLVERVGRKSERVTAVIIGGGSNTKATRPTGEFALARKGAGGRFLPDLPSATRTKNKGRFALEPARWAGTTETALRGDPSRCRPVCPLAVVVNARLQYRAGILLEGVDTINEEINLRSVQVNLDAEILGPGLVNASSYRDQCPVRSDGEPRTYISADGQVPYG